MKSDASILNFARGELVDSEALKALFDAGHKGKYVTDFPEVRRRGTVAAAAAAAAAACRTL